jgi:hypothetical protein
MTNLPTTTNDLIRGLMAVETQIAAPQDGGNMDYLQLKASTGWTYGQDAIETEEGAKWAINPASMAKGFIAWSSDSKVIGDILQPVTRGLVMQSDLPALTDPSANWAEQCGFQLACLSGEDEGTQVMYKASTMGSNKEFARIYNEIIARAKSGKGDIVPIVLLDRGSYQHSIKKYGMVTYPVFDIVGWQGMDDTKVSEEPEAEEAVVEEEAPKRRRRRKVA